MMFYASMANWKADKALSRTATATKKTKSKKLFFTSATETNK